MRFISSASLGGQNISSSLLSASMAASAVEAITPRLFAAGVSGSANYLAFVTLQRLGTGSAYQVVPVTSASVELGTTSIALTTIPVPMDSTDILKVYFQGSASDTAAPSLWTYFYGENTGSAYTDARAAKLDNLDVLLSSRVSGSAYTDTRAVKLDNLDAAVTTRVSSSAYTDARAAKLDNADVAVSTRASASDWTSAKSVFVDVAISGRAVAGDAMTLSDSAITAAKISSSAFTNAKFAAAAFGPDTLGASAITGSNITTGAISVSKIGASAIGASNIGGSAFDSTVFKSNAIPVGVLGASAIAASNIGGSAFTAALFASSAINTTVLATDAVNLVANGLLDLANGVETSFTMRQVMRGMASVLLGKSYGSGNIFRDLGDTKARITGTVDANYNRTDVTRDLT